MQLTPDGPLLALVPRRHGRNRRVRSDRRHRPRPRIRVVVARDQRALPAGTLRARGVAIDGPPVGWTAARGTGHHSAQRCGRSLAWEVMADWIFQGNPRRYDLGASVTASREQWWGTPRYRDRMAIGDRVLAAGCGAERPWLLLCRDDRVRDVRAPRSAIRPGALPVADRYPVRLPHPPATAQV